MTHVASGALLLRKSSVIVWRSAVLDISRPRSFSACIMIASGEIETRNRLCTLMWRHGVIVLLFWVKHSRFFVCLVMT